MSEHAKQSSLTDVDMSESGLEPQSLNESAVSYTHLDVYKRQVLVSSRTVYETT